MSTTLPELEPPHFQFPRADAMEPLLLVLYRGPMTAATTETSWTARKLAVNSAFVAEACLVALRFRDLCSAPTPSSEVGHLDYHKWDIFVPLTQGAGRRGGTAAT